MIANGMTVKFHYRLTVGGEVVDDSHERGPMSFIHGKEVQHRRAAGERRVHHETDRDFGARFHPLRRVKQKGNAPRVVPGPDLNGAHGPVGAPVVGVGFDRPHHRRGEDRAAAQVIGDRHADRGLRAGEFDHLGELHLGALEA